MQFIDSHSHLYLPEFDDDRDEVISRALDSNVTKILLPNIKNDSFDPMMQMAVKYPGICYPMMGIHPTSIKDDYTKELDFFNENIQKNEFVAIGEIGIDLYWDKTYFKEQEIAFNEQIKTAHNKNLPLVIHTRESLDSVLSLIDASGYSDLHGVFHAFTGNRKEADKIIERGFYLGIGGILTFKNSGLSETVKHIKIDNIILETDSPYLAPVPKRGKRNESSYLRHTAEKLAEIKNLSIGEIAAVTTLNCTKLFNLD